MYDEIKMYCNINELQANILKEKYSLTCTNKSNNEMWNTPNKDLKQNKGIEIYLKPISIELYNLRICVNIHKFYYSQVKKIGCINWNSFNFFQSQEAFRMFVYEVGIEELWNAKITYFEYGINILKLPICPNEYMKNLVSIGMQQQTLPILIDRHKKPYCMYGTWNYKNVRKVYNFYNKTEQSEKSKPPPQSNILRIETKVKRPMKGTTLEVLYSTQIQNKLKNDFVNVYCNLLNYTKNIKKMNLSDKIKKQLKINEL
jgi:hypothetical protein